MANSNVPMSKEGRPQMDPSQMDPAQMDAALAEFKDVVLNMKQQMQDTYHVLGETEIVGKSSDGHVEVTMTATNQFKRIKTNPRALANADTGKYSHQDFEQRVNEAFADANLQIQDATKQKTRELFKSMNLPEEVYGG